MTNENSMSATLIGGASFTGTTTRIIAELEGCADARGWFEPAARGGWVYTRDYSFVTSAERQFIIETCSNDH